MTVETVVVVSTTDAMDAAFAGIGCWLLQSDGRTKPLSVDRWQQPPDLHDHRLFLDDVHDETVDVGCGPGRLVGALSARGIRSLGIDISGEAVRQTRDRGARAVQGDIIGGLHGVGQWDRALLADGNIGIGGDPVTLLHRVADLLRPGGRVVVEVARHGVGVVTERLRLQVGRELTPDFSWSVVGSDAIAGIGDAAGFEVEDVRESGGRHAAVLVKRPA
ncbi:class I SAM-dependent methyltransferase [Aeromicrobium halocynthiae]|uniref:Class I SAM-dependent methyltransferase n=1 Tax=Aeromicrobium halocynthiae TaxID=560557 RepID=A0ABN2W722_9ACTN